MGCGNQNPKGIALVQSEPRRLRPRARCAVVLVIDDRSRREPHLVAKQPQPPAELDVLVVREERRMQNGVSDRDVFFQFREACRGIGDACRAFGTPVTGGNVSLYNESPAGAIDPTPVVGMVGLLADVTRRVPARFQAPRDYVLLLGETRGPNPDPRAGIKVVEALSAIYDFDVPIEPMKEQAEEIEQMLHKLSEQVGEAEARPSKEGGQQMYG